MTKRKILILTLAFLPLLVLDLWSKMWAEDHLATPLHPIVLDVESSAERGIGELLAEKLPEFSSEEWSSERSSSVFISREDLTIPENGPLVSSEGSAPRGFLVFSRGKDSPPRMLWFREFSESVAELRKQNPNLQQKQLSTRLAERFNDQTIADYVSEKVPYVDRAQALELIQSGGVRAFSNRTIRAKGNETVSGGDTVIVLAYQIEVIPDFLQFSYAENPGAAWGFLGTAPPGFRHAFFTIVSIVAVFAMFWMMRRLTDEHTLHLIAFGTMLSGAVGNFVDRMRFRYVIDFIDMYIGDAHWPTYNVADIAISIGFGLILLDLLFLTKGKGVFDDD